MASRSRKEEVEFEVKVVRLTDRAVLLEIEGDEKWVPLSVCGFLDIGGNEGEAVSDASTIRSAFAPLPSRLTNVRIQHWWVKKEGMI